VNERTKKPSPNKQTTKGAKAKKGRRRSNENSDNEGSDFGSGESSVRMEDGLRRKKKHPKDQVKKKSKGRKAKATKGGEDNQIDEDGFLKPPKEKSKKK